MHEGLRLLEETTRGHWLPASYTWELVPATTCRHILHGTSSFNTQD
jgi:hypothetical protein